MRTRNESNDPANGQANNGLTKHSLPGCAIREDPGLVSRVCEDIRTVLAKTVGRGMDEVGRILLREFYGDNAAAYLSTSPTKHASLGLLMDSCETMDFPVKRTFLANALRMVAFEQRLNDTGLPHRLLNFA